ncbi:polysaccharide pyruvyl transferase family protein [Lutibacter sp.]|uniref:polysaccharide pyruvyl transferase family protein n=1 Tax=Lutibacter sp. TaxID=1925666 RepID=UPI0025BD3B4F|nr:polysaccharide pyruvyl transferase family protein [Lutibacter sp.]MCF6168484.1 polysaccharide pyruvyl transferase family protein [Lutibacter sp.]
MKIKTITCHKVYNYGATLQEYALIEYLINIGYEAETINYTPNYLTHDFSFFSNSSNPKYSSNLFIKLLYLIGKIPHRLILLQRKKAFDIFEKKFIPSTNYNYKTNEELKKNLPMADAYICGSDQIWNSYFQNGKDPAFYLDFVPENKLKISYAASFAIDEIEGSLKNFVKEKVSRINFVSVREISGVGILKDLGIKNIQQVLDPIFLLDKSYWETTFVTPIQDNFLFVYDFDSNPLLKKLAINLAKKYKLKVFSVNKNIKYADKNFWLKGPEIFLSLVFHAKFILSNSFHAVAFSLIFNKQFLVFNRNEVINTRMRDLLKLIDAETLLFTEKQITEGDITLNTISNYKLINDKIEKAIDNSKEFLTNALL